MIPMMSKTIMNRSPVPLKPDMISTINMNPTNNMETFYVDDCISNKYEDEKKFFYQYKNMKNHKKKQKQNNHQKFTIL